LGKKKQNRRKNRSTKPNCCWKSKKSRWSFFKHFF